MANEKITLRDLASLLAARAGVNTGESENFVKAFSETIMDGLRKDAMVKVKGLGTFKLITVDSRESINVGTGERFLIEAHTKVTFTPDPVLRDEINKPFADFPTVVVNEALDTSQIGVATEDTTDNSIIASPRTDIEQKMRLDSTETSESKESKPVPSMQPPLIAHASQPEKQVELHISTPQTAQIEVAHPKTSKAIRLVLHCILTLVLCVVSYLAGYYRWFYVETGIASQAKAEQVDTKKDKAVAEKRNNPKAKAIISTPIEEQYPQVNDGEYKIIGVKETHKLRSGENLLSLAVRYYGNKDFVPYIIVLNDIKNPDIVQLGLEIKLPELQKK